MNKLREKHPEWNYAGSRSKDRPSKIEDDKILDQRLRPRQEVAHVTYNKSEVGQFHESKCQSLNKKIQEALKC